MHTRNSRHGAIKILAATVALGGALAAAAATPVPPALNTVTAADLAQFCVGADHVSQNVCRIYILGVTQGVVLGMGIGRGLQPCVPPQLTAEALEAAVKARIEEQLRASPASGTQDAARFITAMLIKSYPCVQPRAP